MNNYKLLIQYDGTGYAGWQIQNNAETIQQKLSDSIELILKQKINLIGSGRTDAGVHAFGQAANFRTENEIDIFRFKYSLNSILPKDISVIKMEKTFENFHARFDAKKRSYLYFLIKYKSPFYNKYAYFYHGKIDCKKLNVLSRLFLGERDFTSFCKKAAEAENKICNVSNIYWKETKGLVVFFIEADRFLHGMVRTIAGTLLKTLENEHSHPALGDNYDKNYLEEIFIKKDRNAASEAVPAKGLFLFKVKY